MLPSYLSIISVIQQRMELLLHGNRFASIANPMKAHKASFIFEQIVSLEVFGSDFIAFTYRVLISFVFVGFLSTFLIEGRSNRRLD
jgi:hypothetical protein